MDEKHLKLLFRIKNSEDGKDFIELLQKLSLDNYKCWKKDGGDVYRGRAIQLDELISLFETLEEKLAVRPDYR